MASTTSEPSSNGRSRLAVFVVSAGVSAVLAIGAAACSDTDGAGVDASTTEGGALYAANCASCHGSDLRGTERGPSHLSIVYEPGHHGDDSFRSAIAQGARQHHWNFGDMPAVSGLDDDEVDEIIAFVRAEQRRQGFEAYERPG
jgi:mono/diheme cytochrome c family protein